MRSAHRRHASTRGFDPTTIPWSHLYWTEGTKFKALGLADGAAVTTWPDEVGAADATQATAGLKPLYAAARTTLGNRPVVTTDGVDDKLVSAAFTAIAAPHTSVMIGRYAGAVSVASWRVSYDARNTNASGVAISPSNNAAPNRWSINGNSNTDMESTVTADNAGHMFRVVTAAGAYQLALDETVLSLNRQDGSAGSMTSTTIGCEGDARFFSNFDIAFIGFYAGAIPAGTLASLHAWSQTHYGTA